MKCQFLMVNSCIRKRNALNFQINRDKKILEIFYLDNGFFWDNINFLN